ncbi:MAG: preprotein translocase subunit YajC [Candidatus Coproplasma sp.]
MSFSLLAEATTNNTSWVSYVLIGVLVVILIGSMVLMNRRSKKREKEAQDLIDAVKPGNKVTTIGGVVGIVVEVNPEDNTFVLETGSEDHGKCYVKFIRQAIYESDAVVDKKQAEEKAEANAEETAAEESAAPAEEVAQETVAQEPVAEETVPAEEVKEEEKTEKPAKTSKKSKKNN